MQMPSIPSIFGASHTARTLSRPSLAGLMSLDALYRQRRALKTLDANRLSDIGVTATEAHTEANRPLWDAPAHWR